MAYRTKTDHVVTALAYAGIAGVLVIAIGFAAIVGRALGIPRLLAIVPESAGVNANVSAVLVLLGITLLVRARFVSGERRAVTAVATACAAAAMAIVALTLAEYAFHTDLGIDQILFRDTLVAGATAVPGRMAPNTAICLLLLGLALLIIDTLVGRYRPSEVMAILSALVGLLAVLGYAYQVRALYGIGAYARMSVNTALSIVLLGTGILAARPEEGVMQVVTSDTPGGVLMRLAIPITIVTTFGIGWIVVIGERSRRLDLPLGISIYAIFVMVVITVVLSLMARSLYLADVTRRQSEEQLARLAAIVESSEDAIISKTLDGVILTWNPGAERLYGYTAQEAIGNPIQMLSPADHPDEVPRMLGEVALGYRIEPYQTSRVTKDGRGISVSISVSPIADSEGRIVASSTIARDITDLKRAQDELESSYQREHYIAETLQRALVPPEPPVIEGYSAHAAYMPAYAALGQEIGGDFYDIFRTESDKLAILIGDVSGKGIEAAAAASNARSTIRAFAYDTSSADKALTRANSVLLAEQSPEEGRFVTAFVAVLDPATGEIEFCGAGHPPQAILRSTGEVEFIKSKHPPIGLISDERYTAERALLSIHDSMVFYTDGISEARYSVNLFGTQGIERTLRECAGGVDPSQVVDGLIESANEWARGRITDDRAVIALMRTAPSRPSSEGTPDTGIL